MKSGLSSPSFDFADQFEELFRQTVGNFSPDADDLRLALAVGDDTVFVLLRHDVNALIGFFKNLVLCWQECGRL